MVSARILAVTFFQSLYYAHTCAMVLHTTLASRNVVVAARWRRWLHIVAATVAAATTYASTVGADRSVTCLDSMRNTVMGGTCASITLQFMCAVVAAIASLSRRVHDAKGHRSDRHGGRMALLLLSSDDDGGSVDRSTSTTGLHRSMKWRVDALAWSALSGAVLRFISFFVTNSDSLVSREIALIGTILIFVQGFMILVFFGLHPDLQQSLRACISKVVWWSQPKGELEQAVARLHYVERCLSKQVDEHDCARNISYGTKSIAVVVSDTVPNAENASKSTSVVLPQLSGNRRSRETLRQEFLERTASLRASTTTPCDRSPLRSISVVLPGRAAGISQLAANRTISVADNDLFVLRMRTANAGL